ncbi:hypothetical protein OWV82_001526 [Melia azedarach]|uniref:Uncharacterized protein n=1 Tax=Melia azedarach TaxID=155640 RepID=A0ACC1YYS8_MELAZ|nr:hypothetical protein OWV82_001526 [Melia azedarach]
MNMIVEHILGDKEDKSAIADELVAMRLTEDDELEALILILQKSYNISAFKSLRGVGQENSSLQPTRRRPAALNQHFSKPSASGLTYNLLT